ncbi:MAG: hypothetical protein JXA90_08400 [Planctomycetes bacterium]|nr:hypothetical protein [Planctomycetota bacterium]
MGYDIHITRASEWRENEGAEIRAEEWLAVIDADAQLSPDPANGPYSALWTAHPEEKKDAWLDWYAGNVYTTNPDRHLVNKMLEIAARLEARVQGDENELYESGGDSMETTNHVV